MTATAPVGLPSCSALSGGDDVAGSVHPMPALLLLEHPGPWGAEAVRKAYTAALDEATCRMLEDDYENGRLRPQLIRRVPRGRARREAGSSEPVLYVAWTAGETPFVERLPAADLPSVDLDALKAGRPGHGEPVHEPLFAVCTHGSVDRCCAVRGRPLAAALAAAHPERTWEITHLGGCRFAANLLVLPGGYLHGALTPEAGLRVAEAALAGRVVPDHLRGRAAAGIWAGAAEAALRRRLGLLDMDDVALVGEELHLDTYDTEWGPEPAGADVLLRAGGGRWRAVVRSEPFGVRTTVCDGTNEMRTPAVRSLTPLP